MGGATWSLLFLYSDSSPTSHALRPVITHIMPLLEHRCQLQEACEQKFPALQVRFGSGPLLALFRKDAEPCVLAGEQLDPSVQPGEVVRKLELWMDKADEMLTSGPGRQCPRVTTENLEQSEPSEIWQHFLNLISAPPDRTSTLMQLAEHVRGPIVLPQGDELIRKGDAQHTVYFVIAGFVSLWNEGSQNTVNWNDANVDTTNSASTCHLRAHYKAESKKLSKGTSRLLQVGPGWVLGGLPHEGASLLPQPELFTCKAETEVCMLTLTDDGATSALLRRAPLLTLTLRELLTQYEAKLLQHTASVLSDLHSVVFSH